VVICDGDALQEINRLVTVSRVFSNAAHDLNNALQVIGGNAELLALKPGPVELRRVQAISTQTGRAASALDRLTSYTRPAEAGRQTLDLEGLIEVALALRDFTLHRARITVTVTRTSPTACLVSADRRLLLQIALNLLLNAEHALSARNDGTAALRIGLAKETAQCLVSFADNGPGFRPEALARLGDGTAPPAVTATLSGLGLWVAMRIAGHHRGGLDVGNAPDGGAVVTLRLPAIS
jgi:signal transduction histidine kinase